jgi:nucleotide-binding universal stress UspA family protein
MKTILVPTDFSSAASTATEYAAEMALTLRANLLLIHIYQIQVTYNEAAVVENPEKIQQDIEREMNALKQKLIDKTKGKLNIGTDIRLGSFFEELNNFCKKLNPFVVVMGSQGTTAADRLFFGGHTIHAMRHLMWPLITVPPGANFSSIQKIGLACDFDHVVDTMPVDEIKSLVHDFNAKLYVLNIAKKKEFDPNTIYESGLVQEMLVDLKPIYHFVTSPDLDEGIMEFSEKNDIDLLIILPKRHSLVDKLIHKNHTKQFVLYSPIPIMALHH